MNLPLPPTKIEDAIEAKALLIAEWAFGRPLTVKEKRMTREESKVEMPCDSCAKPTPVGHLHHCLYCNRWYCAECGESHFGETVQAYRERTRSTEPEARYTVPVDRHPPVTISREALALHGIEYRD